MKKILTALLSLTLGTIAFAQNNPATGAENIHIVNSNTYHSLNLQYTLFTMDPNNCTPTLQSSGPLISLPPGVETKYSTYTTSDTASGHPFPIDYWLYNGTPTLPKQIPLNIANKQRWTYMKFELRDPSNPGQFIPGMAGSIGIYPSCTGIPDILTGSGTIGGTTYTFAAKAYIIGGDLWIFVQ